MNTYGYVYENPLFDSDFEGRSATATVTAGLSIPTVSEAITSACSVFPPACVAGAGVGGVYIGSAINDAAEAALGGHTIGGSIYDLTHPGTNDASASTAENDGVDDNDQKGCGKWKCEGYGYYEIIGQNKHVIKGSYFIAYGKTEPIAALAWKKKVQAAAPRGHTARHIKPKCKKVR